MKDIAEDCGVSRATVNQILGGHGDRFSDTTRQRVNEAARRLGYRVNASARAVRTGRFNCVSLVLQEVSGLGLLPDGLLTGVDERLTEHGMSLMVCHSPSADRDSSLSSAGLPPLLNQAMVDGHLIDGGNVESAPIKQLDEMGLPMIWLRSQKEQDSVYTDEEQGGYIATQHLIKLGHRKVACVHGRSDIKPLHERIRGYERAMAEAGLRPQTWVFPDRGYAKSPKRIGDLVALSHARLKDSTDWLRSLDQRPTACLGAMSDDALVMQAAALNGGLSMPKDLSLITIHDYFVNPGFPITTMFTNMHILGRKAGEMMLAKLEHPHQALKPVVQTYQLCEGITTGPITV